MVLNGCSSAFRPFMLGKINRFPHPIATSAATSGAIPCGLRFHSSPVQMAHPLKPISPPWLHLQRRWKWKTSKVTVEEDEDGLPIDYKTLQFELISRRVDRVLAAVTGKSNTTMERLILSGSVRVNERLVTKKSYEIYEGAEIEMFKEPMEDNEQLALVQRVNVLECPFDPESGYKFRVHFWSDYYTDNWKKHDGKKAEGKEEE